MLITILDEQQNAIRVKEVPENYRIDLNDNVRPYNESSDGALSPDRLPIKKSIHKERDRRVTVGTSVTISGVGDIWLDGEPTTVRNMQGLVQAAHLRITLGNTTQITKFRDKTNTVFDLMPLQVIELWQAGAAYVEAVFQASWAIKDGYPFPEDITDDSLWP
jgi:hypothetical protein